MADSKKELSRKLTWFYKEGEHEFVVGRESLEKIPTDILARLIESITYEDDPDMSCDYLATSQFLQQA